jgi:hypothetical protein
MTTALQKAIAGLYEAFSCEPKPSAIGWCNCGACAPGENVSVLISKPLRSLMPDELTHYAESVFLTVGSEADFKYFLPRIMEILATENNWWPSPEVIGRAISNAGWNHFSAAQQNSLFSFFDAVLVGLFEGEPDGWEIDKWICGISRCVPDLHHYLNLIEKHPPALLAFYERNSGSLIKRKLANSFWRDDSTGEKAVFDWFQSDRIKILINSIYELK